MFNNRQINVVAALLKEEERKETMARRSETATEGRYLKHAERVQQLIEVLDLMIRNKD